MSLKKGEIMGKKLYRYAWLFVFGTLCLLSVAGLSLPERVFAESMEPSKEEPGAMEENQGRIYLYGEVHANKKIYSRELQLWKAHYEQGMRHLFIEMPYYTGELLNDWMKSGDDTLFQRVYDDWEGALAHNEANWDFFHQIKKECPETIFHGTDVGHQYHTTGQFYLSYLESKGMKDSQAYQLAEENIAQGEEFYRTRNGSFREKKMVENFIREFNSLSNEDVMGIYGSAHIRIETEDGSDSDLNMAEHLKKTYEDRLSSKDLTYLASIIREKPIRIEKKKMGKKTYKASYFGKEDLSMQNTLFVSRKFWRLENAYLDVKKNKTTGDVLPYNNYPMRIKKGQVFLVVYTMWDGSRAKLYYRSDGTSWNGMKTTVQFLPEK